ncbi:selenoprotein W [Elysia marginata]|uniref:Selenoprotein W n=1 Tax=Elysia marginata TaxID=1093978 RepID=A0AAV4EJC5_9GAST|nr:selenoprotein W [Elysia marginata]
MQTNNYKYSFFTLYFQYEAFREELLDLFSPGEIEVTGEGTPTATSKFEVQIVGGKMIHSKLGGEGFVNNKAKMDKIVAAIKQAM